MRKKLQFFPFKPLKAYNYQQVNSWIGNHPGRVVTQFQVAQLFGVAYDKAASISNAQSGYRKSGIYPLNRGVFGDWEFMPSKVTERLATAAVTENVHIATECNESASISIQSQAYQSQNSGQTQD